MSLDEPQLPSGPPIPPISRALARLRNYFLTGLVIAAPISITVYLTWSLIKWIDSFIKPLIPGRYTPDSYLPFSVPGFGVVVAIIALTLLGFLTANFVGRTLVGFGVGLLSHTPLVRTLYNALKQLFETVLSGKGKSFQKAGLIEFPRPGMWSLVFIVTEAKGEIRHRIAAGDEEWVTVFMPPTPAPTAGFMIFVKRSDIVELDMSVEEAAKIVLSAGIVVPDYDALVHPENGKPAPALDDQSESSPGVISAP